VDNETLALLSLACGEDTMKKSSAFNGMGGSKEVQDDPRSGQIKTKRTDATLDRVQTLV
jgi:hypothetical protein